MTQNKLDRQSPIPLYYQLKEILLDLIKSGELEGGRLPTEEELCIRYSVSRGTVRKALSELESEGFIVTEAGKGTFAVKPKFEQSLLKFYSIGREMRDLGIELTSRTILREVTKPTREVIKFLGINGDEDVNKLIRVRYLEGEPIILETIWIPVKFCSDLTEKVKDDVPIYDILEYNYNLKILKVREMLEPVIINENEASVMECKPGIPAFLVERITYNLEEIPIEFRKSIIRGDRFKFTTEMYR